MGQDVEVVAILGQEGKEGQTAKNKARKTAADQAHCQLQGDKQRKSVNDEWNGSQKGVFRMGNFNKEKD